MSRSNRDTLLTLASKMRLKYVIKGHRRSYLTNVTKDGMLVTLLFEVPYVMDMTITAKLTYSNGVYSFMSLMFRYHDDVTKIVAADLKQFEPAWLKDLPEFVNRIDILEGHSSEKVIVDAAKLVLRMRGSDL